MMIDKKLKVKDIHFIYKLAHENANELMEDAIILYKNKRYARAFYLAQISLEEFGKLNKLYAQALRLYNKEKVNWEGLSASMENCEIDDDLILGIVLMVEKKFINYSPKIDILLHQPKIIFPEDFSIFQDWILDDTVLVDILKVYKTLNTPGILKEPIQRQEIAKQIYKYTLNSSRINFYGNDFVVPSEIISEERCKRRLMSVLIQSRISELAGYHEKRFDLFKFSKEHYVRLAGLS